MKQNYMKPISLRLSLSMVVFAFLLLWAVVLPKQALAITISSVEVTQISTPTN